MKKIKLLLMPAVLIVFQIIFVFNICIYASVIISGERADVDLTDIINSGRNQYDETDIKKLCAEITTRYHSLGYTAFKIKKALLKKNRDVELYFSNPVVQKIIVSGAGADNTMIASAVYARGQIFNELILSNNINEIKDRYSVRKVSVDFTRNSDDEIDIYIYAYKRIFTGRFEAVSDPVYGVRSFASFSADYSSSQFSADIDSTGNIREAGYTSGTLGYQFNFNHSSVSMLLKGNYKIAEEFYDNEGENLYRGEYSRGETGVRCEKKTLDFFLNCYSVYAKFDHYPEADDGLINSGISAVIKYNNRHYIIDPLDACEAEMKLCYGWNYLEERMMLMNSVNLKFLFPLSEYFSFSGNFVTDYSSGESRIFNYYLFDDALHVRTNDYKIVKWRNLIKAGLLFDIYNRIIFILPEYIIAFYPESGNKKNIQASSVKIRLKTESLFSDFAYSVEKGNNFNKGVFSFAMGAIF